MDNHFGFAWVMLIVGNMWVLTSFIVDKPFLVFGGVCYFFLGFIYLIGVKNDSLIKLKIERAKFEIIVNLLEKIANKKKK